MNNYRDEGVIKFKLTLKRAPAPDQSEIISLEKWRALFFRLGFIGEYPNEKIGYGNISSRLSKKSFLITGSQTGHLAHLRPHHYTRVNECDLKRGFVTAEGLIPPSSESLTHFGIYEANPLIKSVFHVHHKKLWEMLQDQKIAAVSSEISYGTQEMANAASHLIGTNSSGILIMQGHEDGIISYGSTIEEAGKNILDVYRRLSLRQ